MNIIFLLLFFSLVIAVFFLAAFLWSNRDGQFDDVEGPAMRMLKDSNKHSSHS